MNAQFELFRFMLVRPPNDAGTKSVPVPGPTTFQKDVANAAASGSTDQMKSLASDYAKSGSFSARLANLQSGAALSALIDRLSGATDPNLEDVNGWIQDAFKSDASTLFADGRPGYQPGTGVDFATVETIGGVGPLYIDLARVSDSILAVKLLSDGTLANLDELVPALLALMLIRRIAAGDASLEKTGAITE